MPATITVLDSAGATQTVNTLPALGQAAQAGSLPVALSTTDSTNLATIATNSSLTTPSAVEGPGGYETVAASQTSQVLGSTGAVGDYLSHLTVIPTTTSPGAITIQDGTNTAITVFAGGASSISNLAPFAIPLGMTSTNGAWKVTTGAGLSAIGIGKFT